MIAFYFDVHVPRAILDAARARGLDIITSQEDGTRTLDDTPLLDRATLLNRVLVTQDNDFKAIVAAALKNGRPFEGVIFLNQAAETSLIVTDLEIVCNAEDAARLRCGIYYLPLK